MVEVRVWVIVRTLGREVWWERLGESERLGKSERLGERERLIKRGWVRVRG